MSLQIGRITGLNEPSTWDASGDHVVLTGSYKASSLADGLTRRAQLLGLANNPDEPIVPVLIDGESRINGFYRINSAQILTDEFVRKQGNLYDYQIDMDRATGFNSAACESFLIGATKTNSFSITTAAEPWHATGVVAQYAVPEWAANISQVTRGAEDGLVTVSISSAATPLYRALPRYTVSPAAFYQSAAQIQSGLLSGNLMPVVGTQAAPATADWRLTNGLVRVEGSGTGLKCTWLVSTLPWSNSVTHTFNLTTPATGLIGETDSIRILRNAPEEIIVRVVFRGGAVTIGPFTLDISLRRGARNVVGYLTWAGVQTGITIAHVGSVACTALTGGAIRATAADAWFVKWVLMSTKTATQDLTNGSLAQPTNTFNSFDFGIGADPTAPVGYNDAQNAYYQYLAGQGERMQVVSR